MIKLSPIIWLFLCYLTQVHAVVFNAHDTQTKWQEINGLQDSDQIATWLCLKTRGEYLNQKFLSQQCPEFQLFILRKIIHAHSLYLASCAPRIYLRVLIDKLENLNHLFLPEQQTTALLAILNAISYQQPNIKHLSWFNKWCTEHFDTFINLAWNQEKQELLHIMRACQHYPELESLKEKLCTWITQNPENLFEQSLPEETILYLFLWKKLAYPDFLFWLKHNIERYYQIKQKATQSDTPCLHKWFNKFKNFDEVIRPFELEIFTSLAKRCARL